MQKLPTLLEKEVIELQNSIEWYKRTYENRKLSGIVKDRFLKLIKYKNENTIQWASHQEELLNLITVDKAEEYLRKNGDALQQRFIEESQAFTILTPDKCKSFFEFYLETLLLVGSNLFIAGWLADPNNSIKEIYFMFQDRSFSANVLDSLIKFPRNDVKEHFYHKQIEVEIECGIYAFIKDLQGLKKDDKVVEIHFVTKENELVVYKSEPTHRNLTFLNKVKLLLSVVNVNNPNVFNVYDKCIGPAIEELDNASSKPNINPFIKEFGTQPIDPLVSLIIPLYGRFDFMQYQLSLFCNDPEFAQYEIIYVVDDPSIFNEVVLYATQVYPIYLQAFKLVYSGRNLGYAGANNFGVSYANSKYLLLLNSDVIPKRKGWLSTMLNEYKRLEDCGIVGPKLLFEDETIQHAGMTFEKFPFLEGFWINDHPGKGMPEWLLENNDNKKIVPAVTGACMLISRELYIKVGGLDEHYLLGDFEDSDLCLKVHELGMKIYYMPEVALYHLERKSQNLFEELSWKHKITLYNSWRHTKRWNKLITEITNSCN